MVIKSGVWYDNKGMDLSILAGVIAGFVVAKLVSGKKEGEEGLLPSLIFRVGRYMIHLHHWLMALVAGIILWILGVENGFVYGFLLGILIQGLQYKDFLKIIYPR